MTIWEQIEAIPALTSAEESALGKRIAAGDENAVQKLVAANLRCVIPICKAMAHKQGGKWDAQDLLGEATTAMMGSAKRWNPAEQVRFAAYAAQRVRGSIKDFLRKKADVVRGMGEQAISLDAKDDEGKNMMDSIADESEAPEAEAMPISDMAGLSPKQTKIILRRLMQETPDAIEDIARDLACTEAHVRRTISQYLSWLQKRSSFAKASAYA